MIKWSTIADIATWKYGVLYKMYENEFQQPIIVINNQSNSILLSDFKNKSKVCFIVKPGLL